MFQNQIDSFLCLLYTHADKTRRWFDEVVLVDLVASGQLISRRIRPDRTGRHWHKHHIRHMPGRDCR